MTLNGKTDIGMLFALIARRLDPPPLDRCGCGADAVDTLWYFGRNCLPHGICASCRMEWCERQLLLF